MAHMSFAFDLPLQNGSYFNATGNCDGTLLTDKIILTAAHCCRPPYASAILKFIQEKHPECEYDPWRKNATEKCKELRTWEPYGYLMKELAHLKEATVEAGKSSLSAKQHLDKSWTNVLPYSNRISPWLTEVGPLL